MWLKEWVASEKDYCFSELRLNMGFLKFLDFLVPKFTEIVNRIWANYLKKFSISSRESNFLEIVVWVPEIWTDHDFV